MADKKISELAAAGSLTGAEIVPLVQGGVNVRSTVSAVQAATSSPFIDGSDIYDELVAAIAALPAEGGKIEIGPGYYYCSQTLVLDKSIWLEGQHGGQAGEDVTVIEWPADTTGILVYYDLVDFGGACSHISRLRLTATKNATGHGIEVKARCVISDVVIDNFAGNGIHIEASATASNANNWVINHGRVFGCSGHGLYVDGADVNAGTCIALDCSNNGGWGIFDSSFLGNTYVGCHVADNTLGAYKTDNANAYNVLVGCYSESGQPESDVVSPTTVIGGGHGAGFVVGNDAGIIQGPFFNQFNIISPSGAATPTYHYGRVGTALEMFYDSLGITRWCDWLWSNVDKTWTINWGRGGGDQRVVYTTEQTTGWQDESSVDIPAGEIIFPNGYWLPSLAFPGKYKKVTSA